MLPPKNNQQLLLDTRRQLINPQSCPSQTIQLSHPHPSKNDVPIAALNPVLCNECPTLIANSLFGEVYATLATVNAVVQIPILPTAMGLPHTDA
jgi:hypothetical protein